jgi:hypothetical protein
LANDVAEGHIPPEVAGSVIRWYRTGRAESERRVVGRCPHGDCPHNAVTTVAAGGDVRRYELVRCDVPEYCGGDCRAWWDEAADRPAARGWVLTVPAGQ